jgi:hypothetical protein
VNLHLLVVAAAISPLVSVDSQIRR